MIDPVGFINSRIISAITTEPRTPNSYELAARAIRLTDSISCGPAPLSCDGGKPSFTCPAHGGDHRDEEWWNAQCEEALASYEARWESEVEP